jgi:glutamate dehydrogenase (NAD(P)+)
MSISFKTDKLLRESAFCFIPASPVFNSLGVLPSQACSMNVDKIGIWLVIIEGANTYSPDPNRKAARTRGDSGACCWKLGGLLWACSCLLADA